MEVTTVAAARCERCEERFTPPRARCPHCRSDDLRRFDAGPDGRLYSYSTVHVGPGAERPYTLGYVDLEEGPRLLVRVRSRDAEALSCDAPMVLVKAGPDEQGQGRPLHVAVPAAELEGADG